MLAVGLGSATEVVANARRGEVGSPCWVLYGKPTPKQHIREHTPFESHFDGSTAIHRRKIDMPELAQTPPMRKLSEEF